MMEYVDMPLITDKEGKKHNVLWKKNILWAYADYWNNLI